RSLTGFRPVNDTKRLANGSNPPLILDTPARPGVIHESVGSSLTVAALGVVYGDIGTSPLYAVRQCFADGAGVTEPRVFGVLSMIAWGLTVVVRVKCVIVLMRADNRGEGGILALAVLPFAPPALGVRVGFSEPGSLAWRCSSATA